MAGKSLKNRSSGQLWAKFARGTLSTFALVGALICLFLAKRLVSRIKIAIQERLDSAGGDGASEQQPGSHRTDMQTGNAQAGLAWEIEGLSHSGKLLNEDLKQEKFMEDLPGGVEQTRLVDSREKYFLGSLNRTSVVHIDHHQHAPQNLCDLTSEKVKHILSLPHSCQRRGPNMFVDDEWRTADAVVELLVAPIQPKLAQVVCLIACMDHDYPCPDRQCLFPLYLRRNSTDALVARQMLAGGELDVLGPRYNFSFILDAGANCGVSAAMFATVFPLALIVSLEPSSANFEILKMNAQMYPNILPVKAALWPTTTTLALAKGGRDMSLPEWGYTVYESQEVPDGLLVEGSLQAMSVPYLLDHYGIPRFDLMKVDIEGSEREVFTRSPENNLQWLDNVKVVAIETHEDMRNGSRGAVFGTFKNLAGWRFARQWAEFAVFESKEVPRPVSAEKWRARPSLHELRERKERRRSRRRVRHTSRQEREETGRERSDPFRGRVRLRHGSEGLRELLPERRTSSKYRSLHAQRRHMGEAQG